MEKIKELINQMQAHKLSCVTIAYFINLELMKIDARRSVTKWSVSKWSRWKEGDPKTNDFNRKAIIAAACRCNIAAAKRLK